jgi:hypothetical protein
VNATKRRGAAICAARKLFKENAAVIHIQTKTIAAVKVLTLVKSSSQILTKLLVRANTMECTKGVARMEIPRVVILQRTRARPATCANATPQTTTTHSLP